VPVLVRKGHQLVRCSSCGLVFVSPRPRTRDTFDRLYTNDRYSARQVSHATSPGRMREARWRLDQLERHVATRGRLLDVGCSAGSFLLAARARGWDVHGVDVSAAAVGHASAVHGLDTHVATLEDARFPESSFDVITVFECIEHMLHPGRALQSALRLLKPDGWLVITTPNIDGFVPRSTYHLLAKTIGAWEHPTPPHHLYQFSRRTLDALLRKTGFRVVSCGTRPMGLKYTVKQMESAVVEALTRHLEGHDGAPIADPARELQSGAPSAPRSAAGNGSRRDTLRATSRRAARTGVRGLCWALGLALYTVPARLLGAGDSMIVIAQK
jgi:2-polyprenyl-3-methyl-5-hydroxy-6-metoxy-1,4-benzoquinol methylase